MYLLNLLVLCNHIEVLIYNDIGMIYIYICCTSYVISAFDYAIRQFLWQPPRIWPARFQDKLAQAARALL